MKSTTRGKEKRWGRKVLTTSTSSWNGRLQGELSLHEVQSALEQAGVQGTILRLDTRGGETTVYFATHSEPPRSAKGIKFQKVREAELTKLS